MMRKKKVRTRKQKILTRSLLALLLLALLVLVVFGNRIHTPEAALRAAERACGAAETEVIAQKEVNGFTFYLSKNESALLVTRFKSWIDPEDVLMGAVDLTNPDPSTVDPDGPLLMGDMAYADSDSPWNCALLVGKINLEGVSTVRGYRYEEQRSEDADLVQTDDGAYFWLWEEAMSTTEWIDGIKMTISNIRGFDRLAFLDQDGFQLYSIGLPYSFFATAG